MRDTGESHAPTIEDFLEQPFRVDPMKQSVVMVPVSSEYPFRFGDVLEVANELFFISAAKMDRPLALPSVESLGNALLKRYEVSGKHP